MASSKNMWYRSKTALDIERYGWIGVTNKVWCRDCHKIIEDYRPLQYYCDECQENRCAVIT